MIEACIGVGRALLVGMVTGLVVTMFQIMIPVV
jgi:hypothetical protein